MRLLRALCVPWLLALAPLAFAQEAAPVVTLLRLADSSILWGTIRTHDPEGLEFERLDNGGFVRFSWSHLDPRLSESLREQYGYVDHSNDELLIEADRLLLDDGSEVVGKILSRTDTAILVKTATTVVPVPKARVRGLAGTIQLPALEIYTREELYQNERANLAKDSPFSQFELARWCERILDFAHADEHYKAAQALDASYRADEVKNALVRVKVKSALQAQLDHLLKIDILRARRKFDEAQQQVDLFAELYAESPLLSELAKRRKQLEKAREAALTDLVISLWHVWAERLCERQARAPEASLEAALTWVQEKASEDVANAVTEELRKRVSKTLDVEAVRKTWNARKNTGVHKSSYGIGTWLLGEEEARKGLGLDEEAEKNGLPTEKDEERAKLEEKIKRFLQNQATVRRTKANADEVEARDKFWKEWTAIGRKHWLLAYYAEHSKDLLVRKIFGSNCIECGGTGVRETINAGGARPAQNQGGGRGGQSGNTTNVSVSECLLCHQVGIQRRLTYQ